MEPVQRIGEMLLFGGANNKRSFKVLGVEGHFLEVGNAQDLPFETTAALTNEQLTFPLVNGLTRA